MEGSCVIVNSVVETGQACGFKQLAGGAAEEEVEEVVETVGVGAETASASRAH